MKRIRNTGYIVCLSRSFLIALQLFAICPSLSVADVTFIFIQNDKRSRIGNQSRLFLLLQAV